MGKEKKNKTAVDSCWEIFQKTGNVNYYHLYKKLTEE